MRKIRDIYESREQSLKASGIYAIMNMDNGKVYVGSAVHLKRRLENHLRDLRNGTHHSIYLQRAWIKYGADAFTLIILEEAEIPDLIPREQYFLDSLECCDRKHGYNLYPTAGSALGVKHRDEVRRAMSEQRKGRKHSDETLQRMRDAQKRRFAHEPMTEETKRKIGEKNKGRPLSENARRKLRASNLGRVKSLEERQKLSRGLKGLPKSKSHTQKMIEAQSALTRVNHHAICDMWMEGKSLKEISQVFGIAINTTSRYVNGVTQRHWFEHWKEVRGIAARHRRYRRLSRKEIFAILDLRVQGLLQREIADEITEKSGFSIGRTTIDNILNGRSYRRWSEEWLGLQVEDVD